MQLDRAAIRLKNTYALLDEHKRSLADQSTDELRRLETSFAQRLGISVSYWSQVKAGSRQIGNILARQFEERFGKPSGWLDGMDSASSIDSSAAPVKSFSEQFAPAPTAAQASDALVAANDAERFVVSLVLQCYRTNPERTKQQLLTMLEAELSKVGRR